MKITTGLYKFKKIASSNLKYIRPTSSRVREALFNILNSRYDWKIDADKIHLLDGFAGTGIVTLEGLSRNLGKATVIENDNIAFLTLKRNLSAKQLKDKVTFINDDFFQVDFKHNSFDMVYLDPPYNTNFPNLAIEKILDERALKKKSVVVCETYYRFKYDSVFEKFIYLSRVYGKSSITFFNFF